MDILKAHSRFGAGSAQATTYSVSDCRSLVKTLVSGVKTITWGVVSCKVTGTGAYFVNCQIVASKLPSKCAEKGKDFVEAN